jgi:hypothetical protein
MAGEKLQRHQIVPRLTEDEIEFALRGTADIPVPHGTWTYAEIVREYKATGKYFNIDYPGGIDKLVEDFEAGLLCAE